MAYINVAEWTPDQVTDWLKGLDDSMYNYVYSFTNNEVGGRQLLNIRPYELEQLGMHSIGHQEIVLEAVENLRNFHYNLDKENLQFMALHVATAARSLHRQLAVHSDVSKLETQILNDITHTISTIKPLIGWLDRAPFQGQVQFSEIRRNMLRLGLVMATMAQRDRFAERPVEQIRDRAETLERLANYIIQDITDPMLLQPASLNLVTLKKRESELGFNIQASYDGIHRVTDIKYNSPAHNSGKIEDGDEIVQINYQTVVGWQYKTVHLHLHESPPDVLLTLKKRPKHTKIYGQIYMQPYRLPSKKRSMASRWGENLPSPRAGFLTVPESAFNLPLLKTEDKDATTATSDTDDSSCSDILTPTGTKDAEKEIRLYYPKPRAMLLQRRNTICGDKLQGLKSVSGVAMWHERKQGIIGDPASPSLRDKSISFGFGLEIATRPTTCIGIAAGSVNGGHGNNNSLFSEAARKKLRQVPEVIASEVQSGSTATLEEEKSKPGVSKVVRFDANMKYEDYPVDEKYTCNIENTILETFEPIPFADEEDEDILETLRNTPEKAENILEALDNATKNSTVSLVEAINIPMVTRRGRLDKSYSTPAYDNSGEESDTPPPAIEPRKEFLLQTPPVPPPRPRKLKDGLLPAECPPPPPPKPPGLMANAAASVQPPQHPPPIAKNFANTDFSCVLETEAVKPISESSKLTLSLGKPDVGAADANELLTPTKSRSLTLKKKHSLVAKRRNVNLKILGTGEIQGHLYRRTKDRRGVTFWARLYFVMLDTILYGFRSKDATKASCVIFLPGFTVSLAKEVHSKPYAFKVYHSAKSFYFATESQDALNQWVEFIRNAAQQPHASTSSNALRGIHGIDVGNCEVNNKELFSETDSSGEENESMVAKNLCTPSPQSAKDTSAALNAAGKNAGTPTASTKQDRRYLGSLRKLTKGSLPFKSSSSSEKKLPVPTDQYRSYRKVPGGSFGIQIGTNTPGYHDTHLSAFTTCSITPTVETTTLVQRKLSLSSSRSSIISSGEPSSLAPPSSAAPTPTATPTSTTAPPTLLTAIHDDSFDSPTKSIKMIPYNFIHASNPNLVEFDFQTSKTLDYSLPKINPSNSWDMHQNIQGFVTLKELMLQKQEEEAQEMYNNRVLLGVEKKDERKRFNAKRGHIEERQPDVNVNQTQLQAPNSGRKLSKTQSRTLPKTPDYEISFKPDDEDIKKTRTKEGLKLRDFGYELISGDEPIGGSGSISSVSTAANSISCDHYHQQLSEHSGWSAAMKSRQFLKSQPFSLSTHKNKKHSSNSCSSTSSTDFAALGAGDKRAGSLKKKGKFEALKTSSEHLFGKHSTMTLPLNKKSNHALDGSGGGIKKSHTYNNDLKEKAGGAKYEAQRKNSAPMPIFSKLSLSSSGGSGANVIGNNNSKVSKEKRLLGSPLLRRTIFGSGSSGNQHHTGSGNLSPSTVTCTGREYDREIFSQIIFPQVPSNHHHHQQQLQHQLQQQQQQQQHYNEKFRLQSPSNSNITAPDAVAPPPPPPASTASTHQQPPPLPPHDRDASAVGKDSNPTSTVATPEYPNMECPPVFEPEIYSLTEPNASINLLLLRNNSNDEKQ